MKGLLSTRLIVWIGVPAALLFTAVIWLALQSSAKKVLAQTEEIAREKARGYAALIDSQLARVARIPTMHARVLEADAFKEEARLEAYLRDVVATNGDIYGSCLAFEPGAFTAGRYFYAPYWYRKPGGELAFVQLGNPSYDHFKWEWYRRARETKEAIWTEPYFDDGGGEALMTTCSVPFLRDGVVRGVATIDVALDQLTGRTAQFQQGEGQGYSFLISREGRYIAHPDSGKVMRENVLSDNAVLGRAMIAGERGFVRTADPRSKQPAWIAYEPVPSGLFSLGVVYPEAEVMAGAVALRQELITLGALGLVALFATLIFIARSISRPVTALAVATREVAAGKFDLQVDVRGATDEVAHLARVFTKMARDLAMRMEELRYTTMMQERYEGELRAARAIQTALLPREFPESPNFAVHAVVHPARAVGGDFFDVYPLDDHRFVILIADVSGKGIPAALYMAVTKTLLKANSSVILDVSEVVGAVNNELCDEGDTGMFVTLLYGLLNTSTGVLEVCNAGHLPPLLLRATRGLMPLATPECPALGLMRDVSYAVATHQLQPGETLFFFTDGVTEALNAQRGFYSQERLERLLGGLQAADVNELTRQVVDDVRSFSGEREQSDDISVLALRWLGVSPAVRLPVPAAALSSIH